MVHTKQEVSNVEARSQKRWFYENGFRTAGIYIYILNMYMYVYMYVYV